VFECLMVGMCVIAKILTVQGVTFLVPRVVQKNVALNVAAIDSGLT